MTTAIDILETGRTLRGKFHQVIDAAAMHHGIAAAVTVAVSAGGHIVPVALPTVSACGCTG
jgi:hypothetical protein